ncbi:MAG: diaminopimelate decarboxylase, partial [Bacteroidales bacterium]|nr:diaminopimelate decarboxylase [Bacteroidales bacterium]
MLSRQIVQQLDSLETPFYLYDIDLLRQTLESLTAVAGRYKFKLHYAIKANFDDRVLQTIKEYGVGIDCASGNEVRKAIESGFDPKGVVYAGVGKKDKEIRYAIEQGIFSINCESLQELERIDAIAGELGKVQQIALRINPDIDPKTNSCIDTGQADSKFGISYEEVMANVDTIKAYKNVEIKGMHLHIGSQIRGLRVVEYLCEKVDAIVEFRGSLGFE